MYQDKCPTAVPRPPCNKILIEVSRTASAALADGELPLITTLVVMPWRGSARRLVVMRANRRRFSGPIVLISVDGLRPTAAAGPGQHRHAAPSATPSIDALAADSVVSSAPTRTRR